VTSPVPSSVIVLPAMLTRFAGLAVMVTGRPEVETGREMVKGLLLMILLAMGANGLIVWKPLLITKLVVTGEAGEKFALPA